MPGRQPTSNRKISTIANCISGRKPVSINCICELHPREVALIREERALLGFERTFFGLDSTRPFGESCAQLCNGHVVQAELAHRSQRVPSMAARGRAVAVMREEMVPRTPLSPTANGNTHRHEGHVPFHAWRQARTVPGSYYRISGKAPSKKSGGTKR
jgi:hypothetical protein